MNPHHRPDARTIVDGLKGKWSFTGGVCSCPAHEDRMPSLSVTETRDGSVLVHCFAGCSQTEVIDALKARGLWPRGAEEPGSFPKTFRRASYSNETLAKRDRARRIWREAFPIANTPAETYLRSRGITIPLPPTLPKHLSLIHI